MAFNFLFVQEQKGNGRRFLDWVSFSRSRTLLGTVQAGASRMAAIQHAEATNEETLPQALVALYPTLVADTGA